jgi:phosphohistidine phosphatase SixA/8-oxo-dGTP pyrophosphatase MutT (NUDIX family)
VSIIRAAGVVVFHPDDSESADPRFLAVHRPHRRDWSLPKGKVDPGEVTPCAAVRECDEETGYRVSLGARLPSMRYQAGGQDKLVDYWIGRIRSDEGFAPDDEVDEIRWIPASECEDQLTYSDDAGLVRHAIQAPNTTPLIILRHAKAMRRADFDGKNDSDRPLSGRGRSEAKRLVDVLDAYGIEEVYSSPFKRCISTVTRYAKAIATEINTEVAFSEKGHEEDPDETRKQVLKLLHSPAPIVVCTHRPVLPTIFAALGDALGFSPEELNEDPAWDPRLSPGAAFIIHREWKDSGPGAYAVEQHALPKS